MRTKTKVFLVIFGLSLLVPAFAARDPNLGAIKARQSVMQLRMFNVGPLFGMAKGKIDYSAEFASSLANNLLLMTKMNNGRQWPKGSDNVAYGGKTRALPEIWSTYPKIAEKGEAYVNAVTALAAVAGDGIDALRSKIGAVGKSCKGCHDNFREED